MTTRSVIDRAGTLLGLLAVALLFGLLVGWQFFEPANLELMARQTAIVCMAALGMTVVIVAGGIDLSVGSIIALSWPIQCVAAATCRAGKTSPARPIARPRHGGSDVKSSASPWSFTRFS